MFIVVMSARMVIVICVSLYVIVICLLLLWFDRMNRREPKGGLVKGGGLHFYEFSQNDVSSFLSIHFAQVGAFLGP